MKNNLPEMIDSGAIFSPCREYRYKLWRTWDASKLPLNVIGLNPSTADETKNDPTIRRCIQFAIDWGMLLLIKNLKFLNNSTPS